MNSGHEIDLIAGHAEDLGYRVGRDYSNLSASRYLTLDHDGLELPVKLRVSDHTLPPSYAPADIDVGPHGDGMHWTRAVASLARRIGAACPSEVATEIAQAEAEIEAGRLARDAWQAARLDRAAAVDRVMAARGLIGISGPARKRARRKIAAELGYREAA